MSTPADTLFEKAIRDREQARNQLRVALSALAEIDRSIGTPLHITAITKGALQAVHEMQERDSDV